MSAAVNGSAPRLNGRAAKQASEPNGARAEGEHLANGDHLANGTNGTNGTNGHVEDQEWENKFLPPPLRLDDPARALKVHIYTICNLEQIITLNLQKSLTQDDVDNIKNFSSNCLIPLCSIY